MKVLWTMADQLRWVFLSCFGAKHMETPYFEWCRKHLSRTVRSVKQVETMTDAKESLGIPLGFQDWLELEAEGCPLPNHVKG